MLHILLDILYMLPYLINIWALYTQMNIVPSLKWASLEAVV